MKDYMIAASILLGATLLVLITATTGGIILHQAGVSLATCYSNPFTALAVGFPIVLATCATLTVAAFFSNRHVAVFLKKIYAGIPV